MSDTVVVVSVIFPIAVVLEREDIDYDRILNDDEEYIEKLREDIKDRASDILATSSIKPVIHSCGDCPELVE